ncbi:MAG: flavocytochrome c [Erysipelotrichaceae bacterium]|nr:flavocytochrome c [Erysipelotrichaceae bacterium]
MKKILSILLSMMMVLTLSACNTTSSTSGKFTAGTYTGVASGRNGDITVEVTLSTEKIEKIEVVSHEETAGIAEPALEKIPAEIVEHQSLKVDIASGATITSEALIEAVKDALKNAGADVDALLVDINKADKDEETLEADVVIIGAGGAGMVAAITATEQGKNVIILEKKSIAGGNSTLSTGGMNAAKTKYQDENEFTEGEGVVSTIKNARDNYPELKELIDTVEKQYDEYLASPEGYFDSVELFILDTLVGGKNLNDPELVQTLAENSEEALYWLDSIGALLNQVGSFGGASTKRIHKPVNDEGKTISVGSYLVPILEKTCVDKGVTIIYDAPVTEILMEDGAAVGVKADGYTVNASSVIIASGGFGGNLEMVVEYKPELEGFASTNTSGITGDGIKMAEAIGAALVDMEQIQIHPTAEYESKALITEGLRGDGAILVNQDGVRFFDEVGTRDAVSAAEIAQPGSYAYLIIDQAMVDKSAVIAGYIKAGYTKQGETYEELAKEIDVDEAVFAETMEKWNASVEAGKDEEFGRTSMANPLDTAPYYAIKVSPGVHHTMGGIKINTNAEVVDTDGNVIPGLFAAGEVTGGVHGANRLGGNAVADIVIFGRIAGNSAATYSE